MLLFIWDVLRDFERLSQLIDFHNHLLGRDFSFTIFYLINNQNLFKLFPNQRTTIDYSRFEHQLILFFRGDQLDLKC